MVDSLHSPTTQPVAKLVVEEFNHAHDLVLIRCHSLVERTVLEATKSLDNVTHSLAQVSSALVLQLCNNYTVHVQWTVYKATWLAFYSEENV